MLIELEPTEPTIETHYSRANYRNALQSGNGRCKPTERGPRGLTQ